MIRKAIRQTFLVITQQVGISLVVDVDGDFHLRKILLDELDSVVSVPKL
jgi:hypothetical protein